MNRPHRAGIIALAFAMFILHTAAPATAQTAAPQEMCPTLDWENTLPPMLEPKAEVPTKSTANDPKGTCIFHQWSWETFIWATALDRKGVPRFLGLPTPDDLLNKSIIAGVPGPRKLKLATRSLAHSKQPTGTGAFVQADGKVMIAPNGYPVYGSIHMNRSYFETAKKNLIIDGGYQSQPPDSFFDIGAAVFKATWLRLEPGQSAPAGAYTMKALVPVLIVSKSGSIITIEPVPGKFKSAKVALVGLHVGAYTVDHPEFLWGTFEHKFNTPEVPDNTFTDTGSDPNNYTFYKANTPFAQANQPSVPPALTFDPKTQKFLPVTNAVLVNKTGGSDAKGASNIALLNGISQRFLTKQKGAQKQFANYNLIGTVWMLPKSYTEKSTGADAVGSLNLANTTAETFVQWPQNDDKNKLQNCFSCHNGTSYSYDGLQPPKLIDRKIALSHVLAYGTAYDVPNKIDSNTSPTKRR